MGKVFPTLKQEANQSLLPATSLPSRSEEHGKCRGHRDPARLPAWHPLKLPFLCDPARDQPSPSAANVVVFLFPHPLLLSGPSLFGLWPPQCHFQGLHLPEDLPPTQPATEVRTLTKPKAAPESEPFQLRILLLERENAMHTSPSTVVHFPVLERERTLSKDRSRCRSSRSLRAPIPS